MTVNGKIDSVYDFTDKGLGELQAWLKTIDKPGGKGGASPSQWEDVGEPVGVGGGIQFNTENEGDYLHVYAAGAGAPEGINLTADSSDFIIKTDGGGDIDVDADGRFYLDSGNGMYITDHGVGRTLRIEQEGLGGSELWLKLGNATIVFEGDEIAIRSPDAGAELLLEAPLMLLKQVPTVDPVRTNAIWNDGGTVVFSGSVAARSGTLQTHSIAGTLIVADGNARWYLPKNCRMEYILFAVGTAPLTTGLTVRVRKNGVSIGTATIGAGANAAQLVLGPTNYVAGDYFTVDVTAIGSGGGNADLVTQFVGKWTS